MELQGNAIKSVFVDTDERLSGFLTSSAHPSASGFWAVIAIKSPAKA